MAVKSSSVTGYPPPSSGSSPVLSWKAATITVPYGLQYQEALIIDGDALTTSKIFVTWGMFSDADENTADMDDIEFNARVTVNGNLVIRVSTTNPSDMVGGTYKIQYMIG